MTPSLILTLTVLTNSLVSSGSGFDAYTSCYRTSRQRADLPCDFATQNWCAIPGSSYPWHAVRRFVHENQGLMRRMYGDERHISVLRAELENNEIEYFYDAVDKEEARNRYSKNLASTLLKPSSRKLAKLEKTKKAISHENILGKNSFQGLGVDLKNAFGDLSKSTPLLTLKPQTTQQTTTPSKQQIESTSPLTTTPASLTISETSTTVTSEPTDSLISQIEVSEASRNVSETTIQPNETQTEITDAESTLFTTDTDADVTTEEDLSDVENYEESAEDEDVEEFDSEENEPQKSPPILRLKGINACPVKEEVVAPFWANNTRGEVLALLNLYPFEQYVHWEKCSYEHKQMFCREGCRCEQQYRLHRLLAYDPNNECRGIFSDWFRFPSCCVCKCYDVPMELRLTSRSPRSPTVTNMEPGPT